MLCLCTAAQRQCTLEVNMAGMRMQGPICVHHHPHAKHSGLAAGAAPAFPGAICLYAVRKHLKQSPKKAPLIPAGIRVNGESQITANLWAQKINREPKVAGSLPECIDARGQIIFLTKPADMLTPDRYTVDWIDDWRAAMEVDQWEVTTAWMVIAVKKKGAAGTAQEVHIKTRFYPDIGSNESIDEVTQGFHLTHKYDSYDAFSIEEGVTIPTGTTLDSGRKLIAIANRITLRLGDKIEKAYTVSDGELVNCWFHEIACHAGLITEGKDVVHYSHGDEHVDDTRNEIDLWIRAREKIDQVFHDVKEFLSS